MARNKNSVDDIYTNYYLNQAGTGFGSVYAGNVYQRGHGIGSFLGGLFRCVFPLLKSGTATVGSELLKTGANIVSDIARNNVDIDTVIKRRGKETLNNLSRMVGDKMFGNGYTTAVKRKRKQSQSIARSAKKTKKTKATKPAKKKKTPPKKKTKSRSKKELFDIFL